MWEGGHVTVNWKSGAKKKQDRKKQPQTKHTFFIRKYERSSCPSLARIIEGVHDVGHRAHVTGPTRVPMMWCVIFLGPRSKVLKPPASPQDQKERFVYIGDTYSYHHDTYIPIVYTIVTEPWSSPR